MMRQKERKQQFEKIIKRMSRNPEKGLHQFYDTYAKLITTTARCICHSHDKVDEVVNSVLIKIWKISGQIGEIANPEGWIYTITANTAKDVNRTRHMFPLKEDIISSENELQEIIDRHSFDWMISELSEMEQTIMIHKFVLCYTFQEIANEIGKPLTTISSLYYRALEKIKKKIDKEK